MFALDFSSPGSTTHYPLFMFQKSLMSGAFSWSLLLLHGFTLQSKALSLNYASSQKPFLTSRCSRRRAAPGAAELVRSAARKRTANHDCAAERPRDGTASVLPARRAAEQLAAVAKMAESIF